MTKILTCPNCGNNKNLITKNNTTVCSNCGYSWVNVSNPNIKSSEIKVVMDSANHYKYTLDNYNDDEHTFPFYAIHNDFIESKDQHRNRLIKVDLINEQDIKQNYVGVNKFKPKSKRPIIYYGENVDLSIYKNQYSSQRVVSDRTNQEYELIKEKKHHDRNPYREHPQRENSFKDYDREPFFKENNKEHNHNFREYDNQHYPRDFHNHTENNSNYDRKNTFSERPSITPRPQNSIEKEIQRDYETTQIENSTLREHTLRENNRESSLREHNNQREHTPRDPREYNHNPQGYNANNLPEYPHSNVEDNFVSNRGNSFTERSSFAPRNQDFMDRERNPIEDRENNEYIQRPIASRDPHSFRYLNEFAERDPERFFKEYEVTKINDDGSVEVQPREPRENYENYENHIQENNKNYESRENNFENNINNNQYNQQNYDNTNNYSATVWQNENYFNINQEQSREDYSNPFNNDSVEDNKDYVRPELSPNNNSKVKKERLSEEQKAYKQQLRERLEQAERERKKHKLRERELQEQEFITPTNEPLTYEKYKAQRDQKSIEAKELQKARAERIKNKEYTPKTSTNKYSRSEKKYYRKNENSNTINDLKQKQPIKDYRDKYLDKELFTDNNFTRESLANNNISKQLRTEINNISEKSYISEPKIYERKTKNSKPINESNEAITSNNYTASSIEEMINNNSNIDESLINVSSNKNLFGKNPRLSFFENLKINNDGTIKEDPLGLNQDYNEFFNKNDLALGEKKYNLKEILSEIKKKINKDKMSFYLVLLIIVFGILGIISHSITKIHSNNNNNKSVKELDIGKDFANQIPYINNKSGAGAKGVSDALVIGKTTETTDSDEILNAKSEKDNPEILLQGKKNIASDLSLEELRKNKIEDLNNTKTEKPTNTTSFFSKTMMYLKQKTTQIFSEINVSVDSSKWQVDKSGKYFEINLNVNNKSTSRSYVIDTLEITLLDVSGNVLGVREIYPNRKIRTKETTNFSIRIPKAPSLSASAYVKVTEVK